MKMKANRLALKTALLCAGLVAVLGAQAQVASGAKSLTAKEIPFAQHPMLPKGSQSATIAGDPATGASIIRVRVPANTKIMPHSHATENQLTVISGTLYYAEGDKFDEKKLKAYPAGSFIVETAKVPHYSLAKTATEFQVAVPAKMTFDYADPKDAPKAESPATKDAPAKK